MRSVGFTRHDDRMNPIDPELKDIAEAVAADRVAARTRLEELIRIPSVSFPGHDPANVEASARATKKLLELAGVPHVELITIPSAPPYVFGEWTHDPSKPTVLL